MRYEVLGNFGSTSCFSFTDFCIFDPLNVGMTQSCATRARMQDCRLHTLKERCARRSWTLGGRKLQVLRLAILWLYVEVE